MEFKRYNRSFAIVTVVVNERKSEYFNIVLVSRGKTGEYNLLGVVPPNLLCELFLNLLFLILAFFEFDGILMCLDWM